MGFKWRCPYCNHDTTIVDSNTTNTVNDMLIENSEGYRRIKIQWIVCPNEGCNKIALTVGLKEIVWDGRLIEQDNFIKKMDSVATI